LVREEGRVASRSGQEAVAERAGEGADSQDRAAKFAGDAFNPRFSELLGAESKVRAHLESSDALLAPSGSAAQASSASQPQPLALLVPARETLANARALEGSVSWLASQHGGSATIDLVPPELGSLRIELKVDAAGASATLVVHAASDAARVAVEQALDRLYEAFQGSGMSLNVSLGSGSSSFRGGMSGAKEGGSREEGNLGVRSSVPSPELEGMGRSARTAGTDVLSLYA
jgi:flagellar hook-length control protein FliK